MGMDPLIWYIDLNITGMQFESIHFSEFGFERHRTTAYHPPSNARIVLISCDDPS